MAEEWRLLDLEWPSFADMSLTLRPVIASEVNEGHSPSTVASISFLRPSINNTFYSDPLKDINYGICKELGVEISRGPTSGGAATYLDAGSYPFGVWLNREDPKTPPRDELLLMKVIHAVADAISTHYKVPCRYRPLNDGEIWDSKALMWKKFMPSSAPGLQNCAHAATCPQVRRPNIELMMKVMTPPKEKFNDKLAKSIAERVIWLEKVVGREVDAMELKHVGIKALEQAFGVKLIPGELTGRELKLIDECRRKYTAEEWFFDRTERKFGAIPQGVVRTEAIHKVSGGPLLRVTLLREEGLIRDILFTGSMHAAPVDCLVKLEDSLKGVKIDEGKIREKVREMYNSGVQTPMITEDILVSTIMEAAKRSI
jgi:lipoate-protein ligase A